MHEPCRYPGLGFLIFASFFASNAAWADVAITSPADGTTEVAELCPVAPCIARFDFEVNVSGPPVDRVVLDFTPDAGVGFTQPLCSPPDPIENDPGCETPPLVLRREIRLGEGSWTAVARVTRGASVENSAPVRITVLPPGGTPPGPVTLNSFSPVQGAPPIRVRDPGTTTSGGSVVLTGENLHNNPFLDVFIAPILFNETVLPSDSALDASQWCLTPVEIDFRGLNGLGESILSVDLPELPLETPTTCGVPPGESGSIFTKDWRFVVRDRWNRPEREHSLWAIPSPRIGPGHGAPPYRMVKPRYPDIDGFGFRNHPDDPTYDEFLSVYGNNAYLCVGAFGFCATRIPDPLYHWAGFAAYLLYIGQTEKSCAGMASTSLLMSREELQPEAFDPDVHFPIGFDDPGTPAEYDTSFCTPFCGPPKPANLWATIRMNHGVQFSREFLAETLQTLGASIFDPNDLATIKGVPEVTLARVAADPRGYVVCFFDPGNGHCVTPYNVAGNEIRIYDNNNPGDITRVIEIVDGDYGYPLRTKEPNHGNAIVAFPIEIWRNERHLVGLEDLNVLTLAGEAESFVPLMTLGEGDMLVTNDAGGRWGFEADGSFTDSMFGAFSIPPLGPQDDTGEPTRSMPLVVAMSQPAPKVRVTGRGGRYLFHTGASGHLFQLEVNGAAEEKAYIQLGYEGQVLRDFDFTPSGATSQPLPRIGLAIDEDESALFHWLGLSVPGGKSVGFGADKAARAANYRNDAGTPTHHLLAVDHGSGAAGTHGRMIYGPFEVPAGASHRVRFAEWPRVNEVVSELDLDRDGTPDDVQVVPGHPVEPPRVLEGSADVSVTKTASAATAPARGITYTVVVSNAGPDDALGVQLVDLIGARAHILSVTTTHGSCAEGDGVTCDLGDLPPGAGATVSYVVTPTAPGTLANVATAFGNQADPDLSNNTAVAATGVPIGVDVLPGSNPNP